MPRKAKNESGFLPTKELMNSILNSILADWDADPSPKEGRKGVYYPLSSSRVTPIGENSDFEFFASVGVWAKPKNPGKASGKKAPKFTLADLR